MVCPITQGDHNKIEATESVNSIVYRYVYCRKVIKITEDSDNISLTTEHHETVSI